MSEKKNKNIPLPELSPGVALIDTHCHLDMSVYQDDCEQVINRAVEVGVSRIITVGIDLESSRQSVILAAKYRSIMAAVGVHPHNVTGLTGSDYQELKEIAALPEVVAYGEIGMDYVKKYAPVELQKEHFIKQVRLAKELGLPVIIHDREAHDDTMTILQEAAPFPSGGVMHCFSGDWPLAKKVMDLGFYISIPGVVTFNKAAELREVVQKVPFSSLLLETDGPFLSPVPKRGKRNEPASMLYTARKVADLKGVTLDEVAQQTTINACILFGLENS